MVLMGATRVIYYIFTNKLFISWLMTKLLGECKIFVTIFCGKFSAPGWKIIIPQSKELMEHLLNKKSKNTKF